MINKKRPSTRVQVQRLEDRRLLAGDTVALSSEEIAVFMASDTSGDGRVTPFDALQGINFMADHGIGTTAADSPIADLLDVNRRDGVTPLDVLLIINRLNREAGPNGVVEMDVAKLVNSTVRNSDGEAVLLHDTDSVALQNLFATVNQQRVEIGATPEEVSDLIDATVGLADETFLDPNADAVANLEALFLTVSEDGEISTDDLSQLRSATDDVLRTTGASIESIDLCLDGVETIALRGISPAALEQIYDETLAVLNNWTVIPSQENLTQAVTNLVDQVLEDVDVDTIREGIRNAVDPDGNLTQPSTLSVLTLAATFQLAVADGDLSNDDRESLETSLNAVLASMGMPSDQADALVATIDNIVSTLI